MARERSSLKDIVINVVLLAATGGLLYWRVNDCRTKEQAATERVEADRKHAEMLAERRQTDCLQTVPETMRDGCMQCTCRACVTEVENCVQDERCRTMMPAVLLQDAGVGDKATSRILYEARATCMAKNCMKECASQ
ncbi:MAG: hypothetical protein MUF54_14945 [Polyangiaceae bacterium]|nr:hypothetical protein [Polyangiaceae bacterium]